MSAQSHPDSNEWFAFADFEFSPAKLELRRDQTVVRLQQQPLKVLAVLLRRPGELVTRDQLRLEIWGDGVHLEFDDALYHSIKYLRDALGDKAAKARFIETVPRRGYRFIAPVRPLVAAPPEELPPAHAIGREPFAAAPLSRPAARHQHLARYVALACPWLIALAFVLWASARPRSVPRVVNAVQLTHFGFASAAVTDGRRLYVQQTKAGVNTIVTFPPDGSGPPMPFPTPFRDVRLLDLSADRAKLLVSGTQERNATGRLWVLPTSGEAPSPVGNLESDSAKWSPDGTQIAFAEELGGKPGLYIAKADGSGAHFVCADVAWVESWSADGKLLRFTRMNPSGGLSLWQVGTDGSGERPLLLPQETRNALWNEGACCGRSTPDGRYFLYELGGPYNTGIWAVPEASNRTGSRTPVEVYSAAFRGVGIGSYLAPAPGKRVLMIGASEEREFARFDRTTHQFVPIIAGIPAAALAFSPNGQWIAYTDLPNSSLWKMRLSTGERTRLSSPPAHMFGPVWSPDGSRIVVHVLFPGRRGKVEIIPANGDEPRILFAGEPSQEDAQNWSPDGKSILLGRVWFDAAGNVTKADQWIVNLESGALSEIPGSENMTSPVWSPDGRYIVCQTEDFHQLRLLDFKTRKWTTLVSGTMIWQPHWSHDSRSVIYQDRQESEAQPIYKIDVGTRSRRLLVTRSQARRPDVASFVLAGVTPRDEPIVALIRRNSDVYALDVDLP